MSHYRLNSESLLDYAKLVSAIRLEITQRVGQLAKAEEQKVNEAEENETNRDCPNQWSIAGASKEDFTPAYNPSHPRRKRKSLRLIDSETRLKIVKLVASNSKDCGEVARLFNVKVQAVYDLLKDLKKKKRSFLKKRLSELGRASEEAGIICAIQSASRTK